MAGEVVHEARCKQCDTVLFTVCRGAELGKLEVEQPQKLTVLPAPDPNDSNTGTTACPHCGTSNEVDLRYLDLGES